MQELADTSEAGRLCKDGCLVPAPKQARVVLWQIELLDVSFTTLLSSLVISRHVPYNNEYEFTHKLGTLKSMCTVFLYCACRRGSAVVETLVRHVPLVTWCCVMALMCQNGPCICNAVLMQ